MSFDTLHHNKVVIVVIIIQDKVKIAPYYVIE